jgi:hypothetical protein
MENNQVGCMVHDGRMDRKENALYGKTAAFTGR